MREAHALVPSGWYSRDAIGRFWQLCAECGRDRRVAHPETQVDPVFAQFAEMARNDPEFNEWRAAERRAEWAVKF